MKTKLTDAEFEAVDAKIGQALRSTKRGTPESDAAQAVSDRWDAACNLPHGTVDQRTARYAAIVAVAAEVQP
jgi:hypothetical protein